MEEPSVYPVSDSSGGREATQEDPVTRTVLERYGLMGCGGRHGPDEPMGLPVRARGVPDGLLADDLRAALTR